MPLRRLSQSALLLLAVLLCLPVVAVLASWLQWDAGNAQILGEMARTVLPDYVMTTVLLCLLVALGVMVVGTASAAAVTLVRLPGAPHAGMGVAAAAGDAGLCGRLCLYRLPAVRRAGYRTACAR